jgi:hypothetical protein
MYARVHGSRLELGLKMPSPPDTLLLVPEPFRYSPAMPTVYGFGGFSCSESWDFVVWDVPDGNQAPVCSEKGATFYVQLKGLNQPNYPTSLGPFDITGHTNCNYSGADENTPGSITCDSGTFCCQPWGPDSPVEQFEPGPDPLDPLATETTKCGPEEYFHRRLICPYE